MLVGVPVAAILGGAGLLLVLWRAHSRSHSRRLPLAQIAFLLFLAWAAIGTLRSQDQFLAKAMLIVSAAVAHFGEIGNLVLFESDAR